VIVTALGQQLGAMQNEDCFFSTFVHRTEVAHPEPTKVFPKLSPVCKGCTHPLGLDQLLLFLLPIILFFYSQTFCLLFLSKLVLFFIYHPLFSSLADKIPTLIL